MQNARAGSENLHNRAPENIVDCAICFYGLVLFIFRAQVRDSLRTMNAPFRAVRFQIWRHGQDQQPRLLNYFKTSALELNS